MRISTKRSQETQNGKGSPASRKNAPVRKKGSQKIGKNRITGRRIMATARILGKFGGILLIAIAILFTGMFVYNSEILHLRDLAIYGCEEIDPKTLERIVWDNSPENILKIELELLKEQLELETWVKNVEIRRVLPSGLIIYVQERRPSVILEMSGRLMIADDDGILLDKYELRYGKLDVPVFKGIFGKDADSYRLNQVENTACISHALNMLTEIGSQAPHYSEIISEIDIFDRNNLKIMLVDDTVEFQLGKEDYLNRLRKLDTKGYKDARKQYPNITSVDLRLENNRILYELNQKVSGSPGNRSN